LIRIGQSITSISTTTVDLPVGWLCQPEHGARQ
jgi:hypothetical protein